MKRLFLVLLAALFGDAAGAQLTLESAGPPPAELSEAVRAVLSADGYRVLDGERVVAELWLRTELPGEGINEGALGIEFGFVTSSALVGAVHLPEMWIDYRDTDLAPGVYTMRYWVQPADGDHMGVSEYRDFLMLNRASDDVDPEQLFEKDPLLELSQKASDRVHPAVMAVFPVWDEISGPAELTANDLDQPTLAVKVGERTLGLVLEGHGDLP
jgi:hypothetical protein